MPLDPLVKAFLDKAAAIPRPKAWELPPVMARQGFAGMMQLTGPKDVAVGKVENLSCPGPGGDIALRAYAPIATVGPLPTLIFFHGGGFVAGNLESHDGLCRLLVAEGGFKVERGIAGFPSGFCATCGSGGPVIALHTEYDANPDNSQMSGVAEHRPIVDGAPGHCEGHNTNGAVLVASALAAKAAMDRFALPGTLKIFGAPA